MDELTRAPERNDLVVLCRELNRLEAKYIIVGGLAMNALGLIFSMAYRFRSQTAD